MLERARRVMKRISPPRNIIGDGVDDGKELGSRNTCLCVCWCVCKVTKRYLVLIYEFGIFQLASTFGDHTPDTFVATFRLLQSRTHAPVHSVVMSTLIRRESALIERFAAPYSFVDGSTLKMTSRSHTSTPALCSPFCFALLFPCNASPLRGQALAKGGTGCIMRSLVARQTV